MRIPENFSVIAACLWGLYKGLIQEERPAHRIGISFSEESTVPSPFKELSSQKCFGGYQKVIQHHSTVLSCSMNFGIYLPPAAAERRCPVVYWLSGLTCTEQNFITKAGAQAFASKLGLIVVAPDTSPRGPGVPDDEAYDLGCGAGFYVNATEKPWSDFYRMYDYIVFELPSIVEEPFGGDGNRRGIFGHSMGGHGALVAALRNPDRYRSVSAFAPIGTPSACPWGRKAFGAYLGDDPSAWRAYDATEIVRSTASAARGTNPGHSILIDQGDADSFLNEQLKPWLFQRACEEAGQPVLLRMQAGYDHSYYFIASFIGDHLEHHASVLCALR